MPTRRKTAPKRSIPARRGLNVPISTGNAQRRRAEAPPTARRRRRRRATDRPRPRCARSCKRLRPRPRSVLERGAAGGSGDARVVLVMKGWVVDNGRVGYTGGVQLILRRRLLACLCLRACCACRQFAQDAWSVRKTTDTTGGLLEIPEDSRFAEDRLPGSQKTGIGGGGL